MIGRELPPLSPTAKALLAQEREAREGNQALKQRALERARTALEHDRPSGVALRSSRSSVRPGRAPRTLLLVAAAVAVAGLAAAGVGVYRYVAHPTQNALVAPPAHLAPAPAPQPHEVTTPSTPEATPPLGATDEPHRGSASAESAHPSNVQTYAVELGLLEPARSAIGRGDYAGALGAIARHQREYPRGQLSEEREALRVRALWGMGQKAAAESAAANFRKRYPKSGLLGWMKEPAKSQP